MRSSQLLTYSWSVTDWGYNLRWVCCHFSHIQSCIILNHKPHMLEVFISPAPPSTLNPQTRLHGLRNFSDFRLDLANGEQTRSLGRGKVRVWELYSRPHPQELVNRALDHFLLSLLQSRMLGNRWQPADPVSGGGGREGEQFLLFINWLLLFVNHSFITNHLKLSHFH